MSKEAVTLTFDDNSLLPMLFGQHDSHLARIEEQLDVSLASFGNRVTLKGSDEPKKVAQTALNALYERLKKGMEVDEADVDAAVRLALGEADASQTIGTEALHRSELKVVTKKRHITPRSATQAHYLNAIFDRELVFGIGPAGTGKTYLAVACAVAMLIQGRVERIILSRPAVEAGERLGFLPGDMKEKVDPYLRPLYDALYDMLPGDQVIKRIENGDIEIAPLAFMRGRTLSNAFVILDEAQNTTETQMKMFLTRLGENSRMVITGDLSQVDLPKGQTSGLQEASRVLKGIEEIGFVQFTASDIVRHRLVTRIVRAYQDAEGGRAEEKDLFEASGKAADKSRKPSGKTRSEA